LALLSGYKFEHLQWSFPIAVTLHNLEEAVWLPAWAAAHASVLPWQPSPGRFRIMAAGLTLAAYGITWLSLKAGLRSFWTYLFVAYTFAMFLNILVPHLAGTIVFRSYTPGVVSAVLINLPITTVLLVRVLQERIVHTWAVATLVFGVPLIVAGVVGILFAVRLSA